MDQKAQAYLASLVTKDVAELNDYQKAFLRARRSYLTDEQTEKFASVLNDKPAKENKLEEYQALTKQAKELKLAIPKGTKLDDLRTMVSEAQSQKDNNKHLA